MGRWGVWFETNIPAISSKVLNIPGSTDIASDSCTESTKRRFVSVSTTKIS